MLVMLVNITAMVYASHTMEELSATSKLVGMGYLWPRMLKTYFYEDFDGETAKGILEAKKERRLQMGKLELPKFHQNPKLYYLAIFNNDKSGFTGDRLTIEFKFERETLDPLYINSNSYGSMLANIHVNGEEIRARDGSTMQVVKTDFTSFSSTFIIQHNFTKQTFSLWIDGELLASDFKMRYPSGSVNNIYAFIAGNEPGFEPYNTFYIDDIKIYDAQSTTKQEVDFNIANIEDGGVESLISDMDNGHALGFSYDAEYDCEVTFSSEKAW